MFLQHSTPFIVLSGMCVSISTNATTRRLFPDVLLSMNPDDPADIVSTLLLTSSCLLSHETAISDTDVSVVIVLLLSWDDSHLFALTHRCQDLPLFVFSTLCLMVLFNHRPALIPPPVPFLTLDLFGIFIQHQPTSPHFDRVPFEIHHRCFAFLRPTVFSCQESSQPVPHSSPSITHATPFPLAPLHATLILTVLTLAPP